jgi:hypothetical protein
MTLDGIAYLMKGLARTLLELVCAVLLAERMSAYVVALLNSVVRLVYYLLQVQTLVTMSRSDHGGIIAHKVTNISSQVRYATACEVKS